MPVTSALTAPRLLNKDQQEQKGQLMEAGNEAFDAEAYQPAFECYHKASLLDPSDAEVWSALGLTLANLDYPREAWRSYRLALLADPESLNALWYASEFLYNQEDFELCRLLLKRYIQLEEDQDALDEADQLLQEVQHLLGDGEEADPGSNLADEDELDDEDEGELPAGFGSDDEEVVDSPDDDDEDYAVEEAVDGPLDNGAFYAAVELRLGDLSSKCQHCSTALPWDAPYCYACNAPCFYSESEV